MPKESNPDKKTKHNHKHYLAAAQYAWSRYCAGGMGIGYGGTIQNRTVAELRAYANCTFDVNKFKEQLDPKYATRTEELLKISWQPWDVYTKMRNIAIARIQQFNFKPIVRATNQKALDEREYTVNKEKNKLNPEVQQMGQLLGEQQGSDFEDEQAIDIYEQLGGFSLDVEIGLKDAIDDTLYADSDDVIRDMQIQDIVDLNCCARHIEFDHIEKRVKEEYADPAQTFWSPSKYPDCRDIWIAGTWSLVNVADIRAHLKKTNQYTAEAENILESSAKSFVGYESNSFPSTFQGMYGTRESFYNRFGYYHYNHFKLPVLTVYWKDTDTNTFVKGKRSEGNDVFKRIKNPDIQKQEANSTQAANYVDKTIDSIDIPMVYKTKWVIGTEFVYDCTTDSPIVRVGKNGAKVARLPIVTYCNYSPSITARAVPVIDDLQKAIYKMRHAWSDIPSVVINDYDIKLLDHQIKLGTETLSIVELIGIYKATGSRIMSSKNEHGDPEAGSNRPAIQTQVNPAIQGMQMLREIILGYVDDLRAISGVNEVSDGTNTNSEMLVGHAELLEQSTNNALKPYIDAMRYHYNDIYRMIAYKYQLATIFGDIEGSFFRDKTVKKYKLDKRILSYEFNIGIQAALSDQQKQSTIAWLQSQQQQGLLSAIDILKATKFINSDDIAKAELYLAYATHKTEEAAHKRNIETAQAQSAGQKDTAMATSQAKMGEIAAQADADIKVEQAKHVLKMKEIELQLTGKAIGDISTAHALPVEPQTSSV